MTHVPRKTFEEVQRKLRAAAERKAKRQEKRATLPWGQRAPVMLVEPFFAPKPKRESRKSAFKRLWAQLDALWSLAVRTRDAKKTGGLCVICGRRPIQVGYHIVPRGDAATHFDLENGCGACSACNWAELRMRQQSPAKIRAKHVAIFGEQKIAALEAKSRQVVKHDTVALQAILAELRAIVERKR